MSYLPRMSKTYKEPPQQLPEEPEENLSSLSIQPASSLLNEKTHNPQMALKQYRFIPHPPPVLPGPSVAAEVRENEMFREASRLRRSTSSIGETLDTFNAEGENSKDESNLETITEDKTVEKSTSSPKQSRSRKSMRGSKTSVSKKKSSKHSMKKKESSSKVNDLSVNLCLIGTDLSKSFVQAQMEKNEQVETSNSEQPSNQAESNTLDQKSELPPSSSEISTVEPTTTWNSLKKLLAGEAKTVAPVKEVNHRSVQCTIFGSAEKTFVVPPVVKGLLQALAFLLHELNREDGVSTSCGEKKNLMNHIQLILGDLCNEKIKKEFGFDITYSDSKRVEKILGDLQNYIKSVYGEKGETVNKTEDVKKIFIQLRLKEMELATLNQKIVEKEIFEVGEDFFKENDFKNPEITLQNKRLESEQLIAQIQFSGIELKKYQKSLAEVEWDIRNLQEEMSGLKKTLSSKSKTNILSKKISVQKIPMDGLAKISRSKESELSSKKT